MAVELTDPEDAKLVDSGARQPRAQPGARGAAVRDTDGRTYSAASVDLPSLHLSALQVAVAMAVSSGVRGSRPRSSSPRRWPSLSADVTSSGTSPAPASRSTAPTRAASSLDTVTT